MQPRIEAFFDEATNTVSYVVAEPVGTAAAIIDPVLDFDPKSGRTATRSADEIVDYTRQEGLNVEWILETHPHADHLTAAPYLKETLGGRIAIGEGIRQVQRNFATVFNLGDGLATDGSQFDRLWADGDTLTVGAMEGEVLATPGHTPACVAYRFGDAVFVGDTLFMPDFGSARCDFPDGDARTLYRSVQRLLGLPPQTRLFMCHDYGPGGRAYAWETTVAEQKSDNKHLHDGVTEDDFVAMRTARDAELSMPALLLPAIQLNIRAGYPPEPEGNGVSYLKIPLNGV